jgi:hypothetical protein
MVNSSAAASLPACGPHAYLMFVRSSSLIMLKLFVAMQLNAGQYSFVTHQQATSQAACGRQDNHTKINR